ncbi:hypothetical protein DRO29_08070 [Candidatus Bathyarchaeota archaeon]|nr:MAG: hypothetical protein DRO29_08070 [Candidatus Bathyarchaeota archaeon]
MLRTPKQKNVFQPSEEMERRYLVGEAKPQIPLRFNYVQNELSFLGGGLERIPDRFYWLSWPCLFLLDGVNLFRPVLFLLKGW